MQVTARDATEQDIPVLVHLYRGLAVEQAALRPLWPLADGLDEPIESSFRVSLADADTEVLIGSVDAIPFGFLLARVEPLLAQAEGEPVGTIRLIYTEEPARGVGVGAAMVEEVLSRLRARGLRWFDARVSPGHRNAKNFFEAHGFSARLIVMHHDDAAAESARSGDE